MAQNDIFQYLKKINKPVCAKDISKHFGLSLVSAQRNLRRLNDFGFVKYKPKQINKCKVKEFWYSLK